MGVERQRLGGCRPGTVRTHTYAQTQRTHGLSRCTPRHPLSRVLTHHTDTRHTHRICHHTCAQTPQTQSQKPHTCLDTPPSHAQMPHATRSHTTRVCVHAHTHTRTLSLCHTEPRYLTHTHTAGSHPVLQPSLRVPNPAWALCHPSRACLAGLHTSVFCKFHADLFLVQRHI